LTGGRHIENDSSSITSYQVFETWELRFHSGHQSTRHRCNKVF